jgi:hypothetical protein
MKTYRNSLANFRAYSGLKFITEGSWAAGGVTETPPDLVWVISLSKSRDSIKTKCLDKSDAPVNAAKLR